MSDSPTTSNMASFIKNWLGPILFLIPLILYYFYIPAYMGCTAHEWMWLNVWAGGDDNGHCWMIPVLCIYMIWHKRAELAKLPKAPSFHGLWLIILGILIAMLAVRTHQGRLPMIALPILLSGMIWYQWGKKTAIMTAYPIFFFWLSIPLPGIQPITVHLQIIASQAAHWGAGLCGVATIVDGTNVASATGNWDAYDIAGGCSGLRSLMALVMISFAWAYLADKLALWKRALLALSAIPLAVIGNAFRVASIFVCAEYVNPAFAGKTWHDWSGLLFFFPISLLGIMILHGILAGEIPFLKRRKTVIITSNSKEEA